jgi:hypothetical protein
MATTAQSSPEQRATSPLPAALTTWPKTTARARQRNRTLALLLATVPVFAFMIVIALVMFLRDEALHALAKL